MVMGDMEMTTDLLVIGSGPAGFNAAMRGAALGLDVIVVDHSPPPGGNWLLNGCIPSQCLFHLAAQLDDRKIARKAGIISSKPEIDVVLLNDWKLGRINEVAARLESQLQRLGILLVHARARFDNSTAVRLEGGEISRIRFKHAVIATGTKQHIPANLEIRTGGRIMDSAMALSLLDIPPHVLVTGDDFTCVELAQYYALFGSRVSLVTSASRLLPGVDPDLAAPLEQKLSNIFTEITYNTRIATATEDTTGVNVTFGPDSGSESTRYDRIIVAGYRQPNTSDLGLENTAVTVDINGFIECNDRQQTTDDRIFGAGDVASTPMLANKATREGEVAAEAARGKITSFDVRVIPRVIYTIPQISWCGLTAEEAEAAEINFSEQFFPWKNSPRALITGETDGLTKLLVESATGRVLGAGIVGRNSSELIGEMVLAIEMGCLAEDLVLTLHPHPTFSETVAGAAKARVERIGTSNSKNGSET